RSRRPRPGPRRPALRPGQADRPRARARGLRLRRGRGATGAGDRRPHRRRAHPAPPPVPAGGGEPSKPQRRLARAPCGGRREMTEGLSRGQLILATAGVMLALLLASLDQTIVGTALPRIVAELQGLDYYAWVATA